MAEAAYGAIEDFFPGDAEVAAAGVSSSRQTNGDDDPVDDPSVSLAHRSRGARLVCASAACCAVISLHAVAMHRLRKASAHEGANSTGGVPLPPAITLMREVPDTLAEYVTDPYALCKDFGHAMQPVHIAMLQSGLMSVTMTLFAMLPPPVGGGDPLHPGVLGFVFVGWNVIAALVYIYQTLIVFALPAELDLSAFGRYELRWWLAAQNPKFQALVTILLHKLLSFGFTIRGPGASYEPAHEMGKMVGWRRYATIVMLVSAALGFTVVVLPLLVTHVLPQLLILPLGVLLNIVSLGFYEMVLGILSALIVTSALVVGPAAALMSLVGTMYPPKFGDHGVSALKLCLNKVGSIFALLLAIIIQDFTVIGIMVYHLASGPGAAQLAAYGARQTCAWAECTENRIRSTTVWHKVNEWVELRPVLDAAAGLIPVDCYAADGTVTHEANMLGFLAAMAIVVVVTAIGCWLSPAVKVFVRDMRG